MSDGPQVYRDEIRKANKNHICYECCCIITKGEKYHVFTGLWDDWSTYKSCNSCNDLREELDENRDTRDDLVNFGDLHDHIFHCSQPNPIWMKRYIDNMVYRGKNVPDWMWELIQEI